MRSIRFSYALVLCLALSACTSKLSRFDVIHGRKQTQTGHQIVLSEVAAQGSGEASSVSGSSGHKLQRVAIGGSYLRRISSVSGGSQLRAGMPAQQ